MLDQGGGGAIKMFKNKLFTRFAKTCSLIPIYTGMYTVCCFYTAQ